MLTTLALSSPLVPLILLPYAMGVIQRGVGNRKFNSQPFKVLLFLVTLCLSQGEEIL